MLGEPGGQVRFDMLSRHLAACPEFGTYHPENLLGPEEQT